MLWGLSISNKASQRCWSYGATDISELGVEHGWVVGAHPTPTHSAKLTKEPVLAYQPERLITGCYFVPMHEGKRLKQHT